MLDVHDLHTYYGDSHVLQGVTIHAGNGAVVAVATLIRRLQTEGTSILLVEQNAAFAVKVADHVYVMSNGTIVHASDPAALWRNEEIKAKFLGVPRDVR